jgi:hypothetical protein
METIEQLQKKIEELQEQVNDLLTERYRLVSLLDDIQRSLSIINNDIDDYHRNRR